MGDIGMIQKIFMTGCLVAIFLLQALDSPSWAGMKGAAKLVEKGSSSKNSKENKIVSEIQKEMELTSDEKKKKQIKQIQGDVSRKIKESELTKLEGDLINAEFISYIKAVVPNIKAYLALADCGSKLTRTKQKRYISLGARKSIHQDEREIEESIIDGRYDSEIKACNEKREKYKVYIETFLSRAEQLRESVSFGEDKYFKEKLEKFKQSNFFISNFGENFEHVNRLDPKLHYKLEQLLKTRISTQEEQVEPVFEADFFKEK
jgi:hypothetical protein